MKETRFGTLGGLSYPCLVYESYDEADTVAGRPNAMLDAGNASEAYRGPSNDARDICCDLVEKNSTTKRFMFDDKGTKTDDATKAVEYEASKAYIRRACVAEGWLDADGSPDLTRFQTQFDEACRIGDEGKPLAVDIKQKERKPKKPKVIPEDLKPKIEKLYDGPNRDKFIDIVGAKGIVLTISGDRDVDLRKFAFAAMDYDRKTKTEAAAAAALAAKSALFGSDL